MASRAEVLHTGTATRDLLPPRRSRILFIRAAVVAPLVIALSACSDNADPDRPAITDLKGPTSTVTVAQGFSSTSVVSIRRSSVFDGNVRLTAEKVPQGMVVSFAPSVLVAPAELSEMTVSALSTISAGSYTFDVRASGDAVDSRVLTVSVSVSVPAIDVSVSNPVLSLPQGNTMELPITVSREGGFTGRVGLSLLGLPTGVTSQIDPVVLEDGATTATLTLNASLNTETGVAPLMLRAAAERLNDKVLPLQLTIVPATTKAILLSLNPVVLEIPMDGGSDSAVVSIKRFGDFNGTVAFTVEGLPEGATADISPLVGSATETPLVLHTGEFANPGWHTLTLNASGEGISDVTAGFILQIFRQFPGFNLAFVKPGGPAPTYPTVLPMTVAQGVTATINMVAFRIAGYDQRILLRTSGVPDGVTLILPDTLLNNTDTSQPFSGQLNVASDAAPGRYTITIRGYMLSLASEIVLDLTIKEEDHP